MFCHLVSKRDQTYEATRLHFANLAERYGNPIIILDLIKVRDAFFSLLFSLSKDQNHTQVLMS